VQRFVDVMWRTIGNMGYLYARMESGRLNGVPVTIIEPGEQYSGFGALHVFNAYPRKNRNLMEAGYRDAKRVFAARRRLEEHARSQRPRVEAGGRQPRHTRRTLEARDARPVVAVEGGAVLPATTTPPPASSTSGKVVSLRSTEPRAKS